MEWTQVVNKSSVCYCVGNGVDSLYMLASDEELSVITEEEEAAERMTLCSYLFSVYSCTA